MPIKVLIIDDEVGFTRLIKMNLEMAGEYEVCIVNESTNAHSTALEFYPDLILLDVVMPGIAGNELAIVFKKDPILKNIPLILLTALAIAPGGDTSSFGGDVADLVLPKPLKIDLLKSSINDAVSARQTQA